MKMRDALTDDVVDRDERAVAIESGRHARRNALHACEERSDEIGIEVAKCHNVTDRCDQHMSLEHRRAVEKCDRDIIAHHYAHRQLSIDRVAERARWFSHDCILASRQDESMHTTRIEPVTQPSDEVNELFDKAGLRAPDGSPLNIFATLAHHPALLRRWLVFAAHVLAKNSLTPRDRELLILRAGWRCRSQYEFSQHAVIALRSNITEEEVQRTKLPVGDGGWADHDAALLSAADELHDDACISDETWATLASSLSGQQMLDVIFTVGNYHTVSFALNSCGVQLDDGVPAAM
jgi:4-carboxymuconolactone decarboxylase